MGQKRIFWYNRWCRHHTTSKNYLNKGPTSKLTEFFSRYDFTESLHVFTSNGQLIKLKVISRDSSPGLGISSRGGPRPSDKEGGRGHLDPETKGGGGWFQQKIFWALWASVWSKNKAPWAPLLDPPLSSFSCRASTF